MLRFLILAGVAGLFAGCGPEKNSQGVIIDGGSKTTVAPVGQGGDDDSGWW